MSKPASMPVTPPVLVLIRSPRWRSQVQRWIEGLEFSPPIHWLLNGEEASELMLRHHQASFVMELPRNFDANPNSTLTEITRLYNNPQQCPLFLLGDDSVDKWKPLLREAGAVDVCSSILDFEDFSLRIAQHLKNSVQDELTVEQKVEARLPW